MEAFHAMKGCTGIANETHVWLIQSQRRNCELTSKPNLAKRSKIGVYSVFDQNRRTGSISGSDYLSDVTQERSD